MTTEQDIPKTGKPLANEITKQASISRTEVRMSEADYEYYIFIKLLNEQNQLNLTTQQMINLTYIDRKASSNT